MEAICHTKRSSSEIHEVIKTQLAESTVVLYVHKDCIHCMDLATPLMRKGNVKLIILDMQGEEYEEYMTFFRKNHSFSKLPAVFLKKRYVGGRDELLPMLVGKIGTYEKMLQDNFEFEFCIIGGGTCGTAVANEAATLQSNMVALVDTNVDDTSDIAIGLGDASKLTKELLPKYFVHKSIFLLKRYQKINIQEVWQNTLGPMQEKMRDILRRRKTEIEKNPLIRFYPGRAELLDLHTVKVIQSDAVSTIITARKIIIASGTTLPPDIIEGGHLGISVEKLFQLSEKPIGKILIIGDALKCLEIGGMLGKMGLFCIMMTYGTCHTFDDDMINMVIQDCKILGVKCLMNYKIFKLETDDKGHTVVYGETNVGKAFKETYNIVVLAYDRHGRTKKLGLDKVGLKVHPKNNKIVVNANGTTTNPSIFVTGSVMYGPQEMCTNNVTYIEHAHNLIQGILQGFVTTLTTGAFPRVVLTPRKYGALGDTEATAIDRFGARYIRVYFTKRRHLNMKFICLKKARDDETILGIHILSPHAEDIMQSFFLSFNLGIKRQDLNIMFLKEHLKKGKGKSLTRKS